MSKGTITITGATGYIGFAVLLAILREGYNANIVVRSPSKETTLKSAPALVALNKASECKYFIVPDLAAPGALDEATAGADYVLHGASPLPFQQVDPDRQEELLLKPAVNCTLSALYSAKKAGTVKRVVCLSSVGAFVTQDLLGDYVPEEELRLSEATMNDYFQPPFRDPLTAYCGSKTAALRRSLDWMAEHGDEVSFDLINLAPTYLFGRHELATTTKDLFGTSNGMLLRMVSGQTTWEPGQPPELAAGVFLDDLVELHLTALDKQRVPTPRDGPSKGVENFVIGTGIEWNAVKDVTARLFPEAVQRGQLPNNGYVPSKPNLRFDSRKTEQSFGIKLKGLEHMVQSIVPQYLEFLDRERKADSVVDGA